MTSRDADWTALHDPRTDAARLAAIAQRHPEFAAAIAAHPQAYPALREWASTVSTASVTPVDDTDGDDTADDGETNPGAASAPRGRRWRVPVVTALVVAAVVVTVAVVVPNLVQSKMEDLADSSTSPTSCDDYLARTPEERTAAFTDQSVARWDESGATRTPVTSIYDAQCPALRGEEYPLWEIDTASDQPRCDVFLALTADQQQKWAADLSSEENWGLTAERTTPDLLASGCRDLALPAQNMVRLSNYLADMPRWMAWRTQSQLGYSWNTVMGVGGILRGAEVVAVGGHLRDDGTSTPERTPGSACGFDPATDAVIPLTLLMTSTTNDSDEIAMSAAWSLRVRDGAQTVSRTFLEADYSSGTTCSEAAGSAVGAHTSVAYTEPSDENWTSESFSVVLKDYVSPRYPEGATADLSAYEVVATRLAVRDEDPIVDMTPAVIRLDGTQP